MFEVDEASRLITESCDSNANIIFGTSIDERYTGEIKVTVIATGFSEETNAQLASMSRGGFGQSGIFGKAPSHPAQSSPAPSFHNSRPIGGGQTSLGMNNHAPTPQPQDDYDVPAFLRNKMPK